MAKVEVKKNLLSKSPWLMKKTEITPFSKVTEFNRKQAIVIGRILYIIEKHGTNFMYSGYMTIDPCYFKGWWKWPYIPFVAKPREFRDITHWRVFLDSDKSRDEWTAENKKIIDGYIEKGVLYIKTTDPILTYIKE